MWIQLLQWGRNVSIPEMMERDKAAGRLPRFNGAGMFPSRKCFEWRGLASERRRFNGAGMFPSRKYRLSVISYNEAACFNGAGMFPSRK